MRSGRLTSLSIVLLAVLCGPAWGQTDPNGMDTSLYGKALKDHVDDRGMVNYQALKKNRQDLDAYLTALAGISEEDYSQWEEPQQIAFWINAYNSLTLKSIIDNYPIKSSFFKSINNPKNSIRQISGVWDKKTHRVMGKKLSLNHIEHKILRVEFEEPRIHVALVCAAMGCPALRNEPYDGERLSRQLKDQSRRFLRDRAKLQILRTNKVVSLSPIFKWYGKDFPAAYRPRRPIGRHGKDTQAVLYYISRHLDEPQKSYLLAGNYRVTYLDYDWSLNEQQ
ncbi:MAG: DUF547 domain-containing protein [Planctomycetes bacterium]|nr:DUF547 domain-containing protein [Planctomycetota bacterium]